MIRSKYTLLGVLLAIAGGAFAVTGGGFPSHPTFQQASVVNKGTCPGGADSAGLCINQTQSLHNMWAQVIRPTGNAGDLLGEYIALTNGNSTDTALRVDTSAGTTFQVLGNGVVNVNAQPVLKYAVGQIATSGASCSIATQGGGNFGAINLTSCARNGVGDYTVTFTSSLTHTALCLTTAYSNAASYIAAVPAAGGNTVNLKVYNNANTAVDGTSINLMCYGN